MFCCCLFVVVVVVFWGEGSSTGFFLFLINGNDVFTSVVLWKGQEEHTCIETRRDF